MFTLKLARAKFLSLALLTLAACGGGGDGEAPTPTTPSYTIGGSTSGLSGTGLVLQLNGANNLAVSGNGAFSFATAVNSGGAYSVTVLTQPSAPSQTCTVSNGSGTATTAVSNVAVSCTTSSFRIKGTVSGLSGSVVLRNNGGDDLTVSANGAFTFGTAVASGGTYAVTVAGHPTGPAQNCTVASGAGTVGNGDVTNVAVTCVTPSFSVGGTVTGLSGSIVVRKTSGSVATDITVSANGPYSFPGLATGTDYTVQVVGHPTGPTQVCSVANASGTVAAADVTNVGIACSTEPFTVSGTVTGLVGSGLVVSNNGVNYPVSVSDPTFSFPPQADGSTYAVSVTGQPGGPWQSCTVTSGGAGTIAGGPVTNVVVSCTTDVFVVSGSIYGYTGSGLVLHNGAGGDRNPTAGDTSFAFPAQASGSAYAITVTTQPSSPTQSCVVTNGSGTITNANVSNVVVTCTTTPFQVGGSVSGLAGSGLKLQNNGGDTLAVSANGAFNFATSVNSGSAYAVTVLTQPSNPTQSCAVTGGGSGTGSGTVGAAAVTSVSITCTTTQFTVGGTVTGLAGSGLVLQNNGGDDKTITADGAFTFATSVDSGDMYAVTVSTQPSAPVQVCTPTNATGTVAAAAITNVTITCVTALAVTSTTPANTTVGTDLLTKVVANFSAPVDAATVTASSFTLTAPGAVTVTGTLSFPTTTQAVFTPNSPLAFDTTYTATLTTTVKGTSAPALPANVVWTFNTGKQIAVGGYHTCARFSGANNGRIKCWGSNQWGQLGLEDTLARGNEASEMGSNLPFVDLGATYSVVDISAGQHFNCARLITTATGADAGIKCWGRNAGDQLGHDSGGTWHSRGDTPGSMGNNLLFVQSQSERVLELVTGVEHACIRLESGTVKCWGTNRFGIPGQGLPHGFPVTPGVDKDGYTDPVVVPLGTGLKAIAISANNSNHTCAILVDGNNARSLKCWGRNVGGQLGLGDTNDRGDAPGEMGDLLPAVDLGSASPVQVSATAFNTCALLSDDSVKCWGNNGYGQLGLGVPGGIVCVVANDCVGDNPGEMASLAPVDLGTLGTPVRVFGGDLQNCALLDTGKVKCWGDNQFGQLGQGDTTQRGSGVGEMGDALMPIDLGTAYTAVSVGAGAYHECAVLSTGAVKCWGFNGADKEWTIDLGDPSPQGGQLGQGDVINRGDGVGLMGNGLTAIDLAP